MAQLFLTEISVLSYLGRKLSVLVGTPKDREQISTVSLLHRLEPIVRQSLSVAFVISSFQSQRLPLKIIQLFMFTFSLLRN